MVINCQQPLHHITAIETELRDFNTFSLLFANLLISNVVTLDKCKNRIIFVHSDHVYNQSPAFTQIEQPETFTVINKHFSCLFLARGYFILCLESDVLAHNWAFLKSQNKVVVVHRQSTVMQERQILMFTSQFFTWTTVCLSFAVWRRETPSKCTQVL